MSGQNNSQQNYSVEALTALVGSKVKLSTNGVTRMQVGASRFGYHPKMLGAEQVGTVTGFHPYQGGYAIMVESANDPSNSYNYEATDLDVVEFSDAYKEYLHQLDDDQDSQVQKEIENYFRGILPEGADVQVHFIDEDEMNKLLSGETDVDTIMAGFEKESESAEDEEMAIDKAKVEQAKTYMRELPTLFDIPEGETLTVQSGNASYEFSDGFGVTYSYGTGSFGFYQEMDVMNSDAPCYDVEAALSNIGEEEEDEDVYDIGENGLPFEIIDQQIVDGSIAQDGRDVIVLTVATKADLATKADRETLQQLSDSISRHSGVPTIIIPVERD